MKLLGSVCLVFAFVACSTETPTKKEEMKLKYNDAHSCAKVEEAVVKHLDLKLSVNFENQAITGKASYVIEQVKEVGHIFFDTKDLIIDKVTIGKNGEMETPFMLGDDRGFLGRSLRVDIRNETNHVNIYYRTLPGAGALQWIEPRKTAGQMHPFLYTQSQAILARTWIPSQDGPGVRITYNAEVKVPEELMAVMSASNVSQRSIDGVYKFEMKQAIPTYLVALAVGNLEFKKIGSRTGIYSEPELLDDAVQEFEDMEKMLDIAEDLYGPYRWGRYDLIVLPPSFPFGGMENPRLTFATPTILAGDKSLTSLVAHELAHSWSGNLVTNATWEDFWLNEGFTVYFERRIMEEVHDKSYAEMLEELGYQDLKETMDIFTEQKNLKDSKLKLELNGRSPDQGMTDIAYEKGYFFLRVIEEQVGRKKFDEFLANYFNQFAFRTMTTEMFLDHLKRTLFDSDKQGWEQINAQEWVYSEGLPANIPKPVSKRFYEVDEQRKEWESGKPASELSVSKWTTHEWLHFLRHLPNKLSHSQMKELDETFELTKSGNAEIVCVWLQHSVQNGYDEAYFRLEQFLVKVGRRKFLTPIYRALLRSKGGKDLAHKIYEKARPGYHSVSQGTIDAMLGWKN